MTQIFLLEDDPIVGKAIQLQLELESFKVHWAQSIQEARRVFSDHPSVDLFLLDVNLPDGEGYSFCQWLRAEGNNTPVIFLTARSDEESVLKGFSQGANDYIRKPFSHREVIARIKNQIADNKPSLDQVRLPESL